ncbi:X-ray radiation resistance-associated protein 1 [Trichomycterus rosablanca]|uniref:X-ray radiation resistance-associated protein 1 n=1 Tax=Trichomycterus rosablanca TaxID=2290929 RepID=UPI002F359DD9
MAGLGVYKFDTGESFPTNCFPIRPIFLQNKEGAGHWLVAHKSSVEDRYRYRMPELASSAELHTGSSAQTESEHSKRSTQKITGNTLDGKQLMVLHCVERASDLCSVDIGERKLESVTLKDCEEFDSVAYINASDNYLTLESFSGFPALRELELSLNRLYTLEVHAAHFPRLEVLDLSYNNLSGDAILAVGLLPRLKVLHMTGNNLYNLPSNMAGPYSPPDEPVNHSSSLFQTLEVLMLDDNKLSSPDVFTCLADFKRLHYLNLEGNDISEVPYLQPMQTASRTRDTNATQYISGPESDRQKGIDEETGKDNDSGTDSKHLRPPFPQLQYLNLANNKILEEEALLALALFPLLSELIIHSNPLTTQRSGDPPLLAWFLQDRFGIRITRKKPPDSKVKPHLVLPVNPKRKVQTVTPKVPKVPLITASQFTFDSSGTNTGNGNISPLLSESGSSNVLLPPSPQPSTDITATSISECVEKETEEAFFVTEINNLIEPEYPETTETTEERNQHENAKQCPPKLIGYEILLDDNPDPDLTVPRGIQQSVRVLEQTLKNLLVYRDSRAKLDRLQKPYREHQKRIRNLPRVKPWNPYGEKMKEVLAEIKEIKAISTVPLDEVLRNRDVYRKEYEEALSLLKDFKRKYRTVHLKTMERASHIEILQHSNQQK